jgi:hypothetical protein
MNIGLEVDTHDRRLDSDLSKPDPGNLPEGVRLEYQHSIGYKDLDIPNTIVFVLSLPSGIVSVGTITAWLHRKLKGRATKLTIDRTEVEIEEGEIKRVLQEKIEIQR